MTAIAKGVSGPQDRVSRISNWRLLAAGGLLALGAALPAGANAQVFVSNPVMQPIEGAQGMDDLNAALQRLARDSQDVDALVDAGSAALSLGDVDAAIGFFGRAQDVSPQSPRIKAGLARAMLRADNPLGAMRLFSEAENLGATPNAISLDRGLAYDLVGDQVTAQGYYRQALGGPDHDEALRRLSVSQAIAGDEQGAIATLAQLAQGGSPVEPRARIFVTAILGDPETAVDLARRAMPPDLAANIAPYLRYMTRLTGAQQAAAAHLGSFPSTATIGREDPRFAGYSASGDAAGVPAQQAAPAPVRVAQATPPPSSASDRLVPQGQPLAPSRQAAAPAPASTPVPSQAAEPAASRAPVQVTERFEPVPAMDRVRRTGTVRTVERRRPAATAPETAPPAQTPPVQVAASPQQAPVTVARSAGAAPVQGPPATPAGESPARSREIDPVSPASAPLASVEVPPSTIAQTSPAARPAEQVAPPVQVARPAVAVREVPGRSTETAPPPVSSRSVSVADAFADLTLPAASPSARSEGAVDITRIAAPREDEGEAAASPARIWVQIATGRDRQALRFDYRRLSRAAADAFAGRTGYLANWGETNRLVTGPFATAREASEFVNTLAAGDVDSFVWRSAEGETVEPLP